MRAQRDAVAQCGLTGATCHLLTELDRSGPLGVTALSQRLDLHKGWISRGVAALDHEGLVVRVPDPDDARAFAVALSPAGQQRVDALNRALDEQAARVLARAHADMAGLGRALEIVRDALREELSHTTAREPVAARASRPRR